MAASLFIEQNSITEERASISYIDSVEFVIVWDEGRSVGSLPPNHLKEVELVSIPNPRAF